MFLLFVKFAKISDSVSYLFTRLLYFNKQILNFNVDQLNHLIFSYFMSSFKSWSSLRIQSAFISGVV